MNGLLSQGKAKRGRKASQQEQDAYKTIVSQVIGFLAKPQVSAQLEQLVKQIGPEQALASTIVHALQMVGQAARGAGADVAMHTGKAAVREIVTVMVAMMKASGMVDDAQSTAQAVMQLIAQGMAGGGRSQGQQPQPSPQTPQPSQAQAQAMPAQPMMQGA